MWRVARKWVDLVTPEWWEQVEKSGCSRTDDMLLCGGVKLENLERIGDGVKVPEGEVGDGMLMVELVIE